MRGNLNKKEIIIKHERANKKQRHSCGLSLEHSLLTGSVLLKVAEWAGVERDVIWPIKLHSAWVGTMYNLNFKHCG